MQTMTKTDTRDALATISQIKELESIGCEIIRVAVPDQEAAESLEKIKMKSPSLLWQIFILIIAWP